MGSLRQGGGNRYVGPSGLSPRKGEGRSTFRLGADELGRAKPCEFTLEILFELQKVLGLEVGIHSGVHVHDLVTETMSACHRQNELLERLVSPHLGILEIENLVATGQVNSFRRVDALSARTGCCTWFLPGEDTRCESSNPGHPGASAASSARASRAQAAPLQPEARWVRSTELLLLPSCKITPCREVVQ